MNKLLFSVFFVMIAGAYAGVTPYDCPSCVKTRVGKAEYVTGPLPSLPDNPFFSLNVDGMIYGYSANGDSEMVVAGVINETLVDRTVALKCGDQGQFDACGAWLNSAECDANAGVIRGWYHAEYKCNYDIGQTYKSVAYAESRDGGKTFIKPNYPNNQVVTGKSGFKAGTTTGTGDQSVIKGDDGYYYMFFINWDNYGHCVARSPVSSGGVPGTWTKYYNGAYSEPGLGGDSTGIYNLLGISVYQHESGDLLSVGNGQGVSLAYGSDPITWTKAVDPVMFAEDSQWNRPAATELIAYPSFVPIEGGGSKIGDKFWLYYMYLEPGASYRTRYMVRREVTMIVEAATDGLPQAGVELSRYKDGNVAWATTALALGNYKYDTSLGYLLTTDRYDNTIPLFDCHITAWNSNVLTTNQADCTNGITFNRKLGWIYHYKPAQGNYLPLYRCFNSLTLKHSASNNINCDGNGTLEYIMGWTVAN